MTSTIASPVSISNTDTSFGAGPSGLMSSSVFKKAAALASTAILQDIVTGKAPGFKKAFTLGAVDFAALTWVKSYLQGMLTQYSGETYFTGLFAEACSIVVVLMVSKWVGLGGVVSGVNAEGIVDAPNLSGPIGDFVQSCIDASILLAEREVLLFGGAKMGLLSSS